MEYVVKAPMVGLVARVVVKEGEFVNENQEVAVINSMKTEISVKTEKSGTVKKILVKEWDEMQVGDSMIVLET
ncbi:MAG: biotin/lipoyl-containing protein [Thermoanaerobacteraceae bacterium]|jgi:biotin carboxyl carrier protein